MYGVAIRTVLNHRWSCFGLVSFVCFKFSKNLFYTCCMLSHCTLYVPTFSSQPSLILIKSTAVSYIKALKSKRDFVVKKVKVNLGPSFV